MFGIDSSEFLIIALIAIVVIGPKDLPRVMRTVGQFVGRARGMAKHFRTGLDAMIRETELEDMEKKWKADNARIMRDFPAPAPAPAAGETWPDPVIETQKHLPPSELADSTPAPVKPPPPIRTPPARGRAPDRAAAPALPPRRKPGGGLK